MCLHYWSCALDFFWSSFVRGCSIFISAVSPLFCPWIAPIRFCFRSWMIIQALSQCTCVKTISHLFLWSLTFTREAHQSEWILTRCFNHLTSIIILHLHFSSCACAFFCDSLKWHVAGILAVSSQPTTGNKQVQLSVLTEEPCWTTKVRRACHHGLFVTDLAGIWILCCLGGLFVTWNSQTGLAPPPADTLQTHFQKHCNIM